MPIRSRQKKPNDEPRQKPNHSHAVVDPMVDPGSPPHRRQARAKADTTRTHHRMVTLAQSSSGDRSESPPQNKTATVMTRTALGRNLSNTRVIASGLIGLEMPVSGYDRPRIGGVEF